MTKVIKLNKYELIKIIKEASNEVLDKLDLLCEYYAVDRKTFIKMFKGYCDTLILYLCLVIYSRLYGGDNQTCQQNIKHWKGEVFSYINAVTRVSLKGNNGRDSRYKAIRQAIEEIDLEKNTNLYNTARKIFLEKEHINVNENKWDEIVNNVKNLWDNIAEVISSENEDMVREFVDNL